MSGYLTTNGFAWQPFLAGCGTTLLALDEKQELTFQWDSEQNVDMISRVVGLLNDRDSTILVRPAYYDVTLQGKVSRDNDSGEMRDIIYANINLDPSVILAGMLPIDTEMRQFMLQNNTDFMSTIASRKQACEATLSEINEKIGTQP